MSRYFIVSVIFLVLLIVSASIDGIVAIPLYWYVGLVSVYVICTAVGAAVLSLGFYVPVRSKGDGGGIAITFDDGPVEGKTDRILDILGEHNVSAGFFCIGQNAARNIGLLERIHREGHVVGNHSFYHRATFDLQSSPMITRELADTDGVLANVVGKRPRFFRPPYGVTNPMVAKAVKRRNYTVIGWSVRSFDTMIADPEKLLRRVTRSLRPGDIVLFHDYCESTIEILPAFLEHVKKLGLKVVRVDELLNEKPYA
jgi:peptidoglycan-N-acetylglucosamine deacetylase